MKIWPGPDMLQDPYPAARLTAMQSTCLLAALLMQPMCDLNPDPTEVAMLEHYLSKMSARAGQLGR